MLIDLSELCVFTFDDAHKSLCLESSFSPIILVNGEMSHAWIIDSSASLHVTPHREWFSRYEETVGTVTLGDSYACNIVGIGDITMVFSNGMRFTIENVCHVPCLTRNLIFVAQLDDLDYKVTFSQQSWKITKSSLLVAIGSKVCSLYPLFVCNKDSVLSMTKVSSISLWHSRLGHMSRKAMETLCR